MTARIPVAQLQLQAALLGQLGLLGLRGSEMGLLRVLLVEAQPVDSGAWALPAQAEDLDHRWSWSRLEGPTGFCRRALQYAKRHLVQLGLVQVENRPEAFLPNRFILKMDQLRQALAAAQEQRRQERLRRVLDYGGAASPEASPEASEQPTPTPPPAQRQGPSTTLAWPTAPSGPEPDRVPWALERADELLRVRGMPRWATDATREQPEDLARITLAWACLVYPHAPPGWVWEEAGGWVRRLAVLWRTAERPGGSWVRKLALVLWAARVGVWRRVQQTMHGAQVKEKDLDNLLRPRAWPGALRAAAAVWEDLEAQREREAYAEVYDATRSRLRELVLAAEDAGSVRVAPGEPPAAQAWIAYAAQLRGELRHHQDVAQGLEDQARIELAHEALDRAARLGRAPPREALGACLRLAVVLVQELGLDAGRHVPGGLAPPTRGPPA